jgi:hypothetical protein
MTKPGECSPEGAAAVGLRRPWPPWGPQPVASVRERERKLFTEGQRFRDCCRTLLVNRAQEQGQGLSSHRVGRLAKVTKRQVSTIQHSYPASQGPEIPGHGLQKSGSERRPAFYLPAILVAVSVPDQRVHGLSQNAPSCCQVAARPSEHAGDLPHRIPCPRAADTRRQVGLSLMSKQVAPSPP